LKKFGAKSGAWAGAFDGFKPNRAQFSPPVCFVVVTGATDGIGKEFALQLGKAGFNIILASRTQEKLTAVASEIGNS
jgi:17beta-estradiol 17-dehydrogenase / very-long-chain 3-oxoacyl-CoA reductase